MLVILNKLVEEYSDRLVINCNDAYLYDLPEETIKKEILKGNVCDNVSQDTESVDGVLTCIRHSIDNGIFTGKREPYIEQYLLHGNTNFNNVLVLYVETITTGDYPDIEYLIYKSIYNSVVLALHTGIRLLKFEDYITPYDHNVNRDSEYNRFIRLYEYRFNVSLSNME